MGEDPPRSTPVPASDGETACPPCSHPAPTGCNGSHPCQCSRRDLARATEDHADNRTTRRADTAWCLGSPGRVLASAQRPARHSPTAVAGHPSTSVGKTTHRSYVSRGAVTVAPRAGYHVPPTKPRTGLPTNCCCWSPYAGGSVVIYGVNVPRSTYAWSVMITYGRSSNTRPPLPSCRTISRRPMP